MTERQLLSKLVKELKAAYPSSWFYKIPDSYGGKKKPFDLICAHEGRAYAFEAKVGGAKLKPHQEAALKEFAAAGGFAGVIRFKGKAIFVQAIMFGYLPYFEVTSETLLTETSKIKRSYNNDTQNRNE